MNDHEKRGEHEKIRRLLSLAAADALDEAELIQVQRHSAQCAECAAELERWHTLGGALRALQTPQPSAALLQRTRTLAAAAMTPERAPNRERVTLAWVVAFAWVVTLASWPVLRVASSGVLNWFDIAQPSWLVFSIYAAVGWMTAAVAAAMLAASNRGLRSIR